jgi:hypothetical protein
VAKDARECKPPAESLHRRNPLKTPWEWAPQIVVHESMGLRVAPLSATETVGERPTKLGGTA